MGHTYWTGKAGDQNFANPRNWTNGVPADVEVIEFPHPPLPPCDDLIYRRRPASLPWWKKLLLLALIPPAYVICVASVIVLLIVMALRWAYVTVTK